MKGLSFLSGLILITVLSGCGPHRQDADSFADSFVEISGENPYCFQLSNGDPYIAIGCNIAAMRDYEAMEKYIGQLSANGANFGRVWLNSAFLEVETEYGALNTENLAHIDRLLELATQHGLKIKMCIESFRFIEPDSRWDVKKSYHVANGGPFNNMWEYLTSQRGRDEYIRRLEILQRRYGDHPAIFGWELWNEMNAVNYKDFTEEQNYPALIEWNTFMLEKVKRMFPRNLVMQSLGSLDRESSFGIYKDIISMPGNEVSQVHRYLDLGARLAVCHASMDSLCSDAIRFLTDLDLRKPMLLAEGGAVKPDHTGPHEFYETDNDGILLHDVLFTPFFCGAAGSGHIWHWDHYIEKRNVWFQFSRFAAAVEGINPIKEKFAPCRRDNDDLRVYSLEGRNTILAWCRDKGNDWQSEFVEMTPPRILSGQTVDLSAALGGRKAAKTQIYDPWEDTWSDAAPSGNVALPDFKRSIVIKISLK